MGHKPRSPEEILEELKETLSEAKGVVKDLTQANQEARRIIAELAQNEVHDRLKPVLEETYGKVREIADNWNEKTEEMFHDLAVTVEAMVKRYASAKPMQNLGLPQEREIALGVITGIMHQEALTSGEEARTRVKAMDPGTITRRE
jgi:sugar-specific transcriptional regulator TrmB